MSVNLVHNGTIDGPYRVALDTTNITDVTPVWTNSDKAKVASIAIANVDTGAAVWCELYYNDGSNDHLFAVYDVPQSSTVILADFPLQMKDGWKLRAKAESANDIVVTAIMALQPRG